MTRVIRDASEIIAMENLINNINSFFENIDTISEIKDFVNAFETNNFTKKKNRLFSEHNLTKFINRDIFRKWKDSDDYNENITYIKNIYDNEKKKRKKISKEKKEKKAPDEKTVGQQVFGHEGVRQTIMREKKKIEC